MLCQGKTVYFDRMPTCFVRAADVPGKTKAINLTVAKEIAERRMSMIAPLVSILSSPEEYYKSAVRFPTCAINEYFMSMPHPREPKRPFVALF